MRFMYKRAALAAHILKLEQYREDYHGPCPKKGVQTSLLGRAREVWQKRFSLRSGNSQKARQIQNVMNEKYRRITWEVCVLLYHQKLVLILHIYTSLLFPLIFCRQTFHAIVHKLPHWWDNTNCHSITCAPPFYLFHIWNTSKVPFVVCIFSELVPQALLLFFSFNSFLCCRELHYFSLVVVAAKEMALASS